VLDWDLAHPYDPAIDVGCPAHWHGWPAIGRTVDAATYARARTWSGTFALEQIVKTLLDGPTTARSVPASNRSSDGWTATAATERGTPPVNISYELHSICCCQRSPVAASL
jgi:aminoglycoside phosphotransferase (APT) family kinase protein